MWAIALYPLDRNFDLQDRLGLGNQLPIPQLHGNATAIRGNGRRGEEKKGRRRGASPSSRLSGGGGELGTATL